MDLLLIRHGLPERVEPGSGTPADPGLSDEGWRQAHALASWLSFERIDLVITSPLRRARETALPLERLHGLRATVVDEVAEWDRGNDSYVPMEEQKAAGHPDWQALVDRDWDAMPFDIFAFQQRVVDAVDAIAARHPGSTVAVVCHGGVLNVYLASVLGLPEPLFFEPAYTGVSRVRVSREGRRGVVSVNEAAHLRDL
jgi:probable phosphoglycerate mutase